MLALLAADWPPTAPLVHHLNSCRERLLKWMALFSIREQPKQSSLHGGNVLAQARDVARQDRPAFVCVRLLKVHSSNMQQNRPIFTHNEARVISEYSQKKRGTYATTATMLVYVIFLRAGHVSK